MFNRPPRHLEREDRGRPGGVAVLELRALQETRCPGLEWGPPSDPSGRRREPHARAPRSGPICVRWASSLDSFANSEGASGAAEEASRVGCSASSRDGYTAEALDASI